jgi:hypothetical protein
MNPSRSALVVLGRLIVAVAIALSFSAPVHAQSANLESAVRATFLYRFGSFVEWPATAFADPSAQIDVCIYGDAPFARLVEEAASHQRVGARAMAVRSIATIIGQSCHILYLGVAPTAEEAFALEGAPVLTVTSQTNAGVPAGMVHFVIVDGRQRFEIDEAAATRSRLRISSRLLNIASSVRRR